MELTNNRDITEYPTRTQLRAIPRTIPHAKSKGGLFPIYGHENPGRQFRLKLIAVIVFLLLQFSALLAYGALTNDASLPLLDKVAPTPTVIMCEQVTLNFDQNGNQQATAYNEACHSK